ncbi:hypothetical protein GIB67_024848, partial [Kingdonia uniflora]
HLLKCLTTLESKVPHKIFDLQQCLTDLELSLKRQGLVLDSKTQPSFFTIGHLLVFLIGRLRFGRPINFFFHKKLNR